MRAAKFSRAAAALAGAGLEGNKKKMSGNNNGNQQAGAVIDVAVLFLEPWTPVIAAQSWNLFTWLWDVRLDSISVSTRF